MIFEIFSYGYVINALLSALIIAITAPIMGMFVVSRRISLIGDTLSHVALAGIAIGIFLNFVPTITAITIVVIASMFLLKLIQTGNVNADAVLAVFFASSTAIAVVLLSISTHPVNLWEILFGKSILLVTEQDLLLLFMISAIIVTTTVFIYKKWFIITIDQELSKINNINVNFYDNILIVLTAVLIVLAIRIIGVLLVSSLLVLPILIALQFSSSFKNTIFNGIIISAICSVTGVITAFYLPTHPVLIPPGGIIVIILSLLFVIVLSRNMIKNR
tara:strand:- start:475 stop:1299 length:825 start_codon:yes stop_codon:yes gene_type:complete